MASGDASDVSDPLIDLLENDPPPPYSLNPDIQLLTLEQTRYTHHGDQAVLGGSIIQMQRRPTLLIETSRSENEEESKGKRRDQLIRNAYKQINAEEVNVYLPDAEVTFEDAANRIRKVEIGERQPGCKEKVIMIVGATGSGKSTLINGMFNHILGIEWKDDYRLKLIEEGKYVNQAQSQTNWITSYTIHHRPEFTVPYSLTIIDTPGFGDTAGIKRDQEITDQIRACFTTQGPGGVDSLDAVGFVAQCSLPRLSPSQRYIFDSILSLFGKDIADNIFMLLTFADGQKPQVLSGIKEAKIPFKNFFKFNNSALYVSNKKSTEDDEYGEEDNFDEMFWKMGRKSFKIFTTQLSKLPTKSLVLTKDVLEERCRLEVTVEGIQRDVKMGLNKLEQLRKEHQALDHHQADIDKNKKFTYTVNEQIIETEKTRPGQFTTNCISCNRTCHDDCAFADNADKARCWAMGHGNGEACRICPQHCHWSMHKNHPYVYVIRMHSVTKTEEDLKKKYQIAKGKKATAEQMVQQCQAEFENFQLQVLEMVEQARKSIARLNEIALRPNPLSTVDYIDILIASEKAEARPGWKERVEQLDAVKEKAEQMQALAQQGYDPFAAVKKQYDDERKQRHRDQSQQQYDNETKQQQDQSQQRNQRKIPVLRHRLKTVIIPVVVEKK